MSKYKFLDDVNFPSDIKKFSNSDLKILSNEIREKMIDAVSKTGGHWRLLHRGFFKSFRFCPQGSRLPHRKNDDETSRIPTKAC